MDSRPGGGGGGGGGASQARRIVAHHRYQGFYFASAAAAASGKSGDDGDTRAMVREAVEEEYRKKTSRRRKRKRGTGGGNDDDAFGSSGSSSSDDDGMETKKWDQKQEGDGNGEVARGNAVSGKDGGSQNNKYRDRAKERREGRAPVESSDSESASSMEEEGGSGGSAGDESTTYARTADEARGLLLSSLSMPPSTSTFRPRSALGHDVLAFLRDAARTNNIEAELLLKETGEQSSAESRSNNHNNNVRPVQRTVAGPTPAGLAVRRTILRFATQTHPGDWARSWQIPTEGAAAGVWLGRNHGANMDASSQSSTTSLLDPDIVARISAALRRRRFFQAEQQERREQPVAQQNEQPRQKPSATAVMRAADKEASAPLALSPPKQILDHTDNAEAAEDENDDDDDDDIFGNVGEYDPVEDEEENQESRGDSGGSSPRADGGPRSVAQHRSLFGGILSSVPTSVAPAVAPHPLPSESSAPMDSTVASQRLTGLVADGGDCDYGISSFTAWDEGDEDDDDKAKKKRKKKRNKNSGDSDSD
jgi:hypothetical protein